ncbi:MAG: c-type cytochrome [Planctomycetes bacterium]|nr:c-type cytochrome [Planctomycetota bacterium]
MSSTLSASERTRWESHLGPADERLKWETVGLKRLPSADASSFSVEDSLAGNSLRRTWLWALSRTPIPPSPKNNNANKLDTQIGTLLFGPPKNNVDTGVFETLSTILTSYRNSTSTRDPLELLTVIQSALGDRRWTLPLQSEVPADALDGYRGIHTAKMQDTARNSWARWALHFAETAESNGQVILHAEAMRTMAMLESSDKECIAYLLRQIQPDSHPTSDLHALCCIAQCTASRTPDESSMTASGLANIIGKVKSRGLYTDNQWPTRLKQLVQSLSSRDPKFGEAFAALPSPSTSEDLVLVSAFSNDIQASIKQKIREHLRSTPIQQWSVPIVKYALTGSIDDGFRALLQQATSEEALRGTCLDILSSEPKASDYDIYLSAVESSDRTLWPAAWKGIASMDLLDPQRELGAMAKLVSASLNTNVSLPRPAVLKRARSLAAQTQKPTPPSSESWADWDQYYRSNLTEQQCEALISPSTRVDVNTALQSIQNLVGNAANGKSLYQAKCGLCHGGQSSLGPSLVGVAKRFSREDLARAIYEPSRDVSDRYRAVRVLTVDDEILTGMVIYNAADGVTLQAADGSILRINQDTITEKAYSTESLMPNGLLEDKSPQEVADLFAYLGTLQ